MVEIQDTYFRRFFVPIIITILIFCGAAVVVFVAPGTPVNMPTFSTALGTIAKKGGFLKK